MTDSLHISADTLATVADTAAIIEMPRLPEDIVHPFDATLDTALIAAYMPADTVAADTVATVAVPDWHEGLEPVQRPDMPASNNTFLMAMAAIFVIITLNFKHLLRLIGVYGQELVKVRRGRDNVFSDRPAADTRLLIMLIVLAVVCGAIVADGAWAHFDASIEVSQGGVGRLVALLGGYYLFQLTAYQTVGYTFSTPEGRREWVRGFNASQALLGMLLVIPAALTIFYPVSALVTAYIGLGAFVLAKIMFIFKGFRIFYDKISSLLYFILYLCTLEIIPLVWTYICALWILA